MSQTGKFVHGFERLVDAVTWNMLFLASSLTFILVVLAGDVPMFAVILGGFVVAYGLIAFVAYKRTNRLNEEEAKAETKQSGQLADSIANIMAVKSYGREEHERRRYAGVANATYVASRGLMRAMIGRDVVFSAVYVGIMAALMIFLIGGPGWFGISVGTMVLIVSYTQQVLSNLWDINYIFRDFNRVFGDAYEMTLILDTPTMVEDKRGAGELVVERGEVEFGAISFKHPEAKTALFEDFSLKVKAGERVGLVGVSGSGKTTLTKLLLRFADVIAI